MQFQIYMDARSEYRWRLRANNNEIIAVSGEGYQNKSDCSHAINLIKSNAAYSSVIDTTIQAAYSRW